MQIYYSWVAPPQLQWMKNTVSHKCHRWAEKCRPYRDMRFFRNPYLSVVPWVGVHVRYPLSALVVFLSLMSQERPSQGGGGGTHHVMHGRSRMTIDPRIPPMPRHSTSGFHRPGRYCLHQARSSVRCWASSMEDEPHPSKMTAASGLICSLLRPIVPGYSNSCTLKPPRGCLVK